jgi:hypothetical protein
MEPKPKLVITDSQVFLKADASIPKEIPLTSFSIVLARQKGDFQQYIKGTPKIGELKDGDRILILESCSHHVSCDDIGRVKIPRWLSNFTGKKLSHYTFPQALDAVWQAHPRRIVNGKDGTDSKIKTYHLSFYDALMHAGYKAATPNPTVTVAESPKPTVTTATPKPTTTTNTQLTQKTFLQLIIEIIKKLFGGK